MASQEASSQCTHQVFLSCRGKDTGQNFTDHLYTALLNGGFSTFRSDEGIEKCENIKSELEKAVKEARSSLVVFSKGYASSEWCLDQLVMILDHKRSSGHVILPVFYDVDPSDVRKQRGSFAEAFERHEERIEMETDEKKGECLKKEVERWREALREVADLAGMVLKNQADGHESKFIQNIVNVIGEKLRCTVLNITPYLTGIGCRVKKVNSWLLDESTDVGIMVIYGMGGIGKTTMAKFVYNLNFQRFEASSFLSNIRGIAEHHKGLVKLQKQLLFDIVNKKEEQIYSVDDGITKIRYAVGCKRVLVVLDDVDKREQFDAVIGNRNWFHSGSKIIITTRQKDILKASEVFKMCKVEELGSEDSLELLSWHAFGQDHPTEGFMEHSKKVAQCCGGIPLALKVLGSSLSGKSVKIWEDTSRKLAAIPNSKILEILKVSYDSLPDDNVKNLFLHIACFFVGKRKNFVARILHECGFYTSIEMDNLINRCLLTIDGEKEKLMMHELLQDMGREIVRQESPKEPGKRSRLWEHKESFTVLQEEKGTGTVEGLFLDMHVLGEDKRSSDESLEKHGLGSLSWNPMNIFTRNKNQVQLKIDAFDRMKNLRLLQLNYVEIEGRYKDLPKGLRLLRWHGFPLKCIPYDFPLGSLVALDMRNSFLEHFWKGNKLLRLLKILNLSHSHGLASTPNFKLLPNLEKLMLKDCINLVEVHDSICNLERLTSLNLKGCTNLEKLPTNICHLASLEELILSGCSKLGQLPAELGKMKSLLVFHADGISINRNLTTTNEAKPWSLPFWRGRLKIMQSAQCSYFSLASLPCFLTRLSLSNCNLSSDDIPQSVGRLSHLQELILSYNPISSLPETFKDLSSLQLLDVAYCLRLQSLPELPMSLDDLMMEGCESLETVPNLPISLMIRGVNGIFCEKLVKVPGIFKLGPIENADAKMLSNLGLVDLQSVGSLKVQLVNYLACTTKKGPPLQGLYECGIYSIFLPRSEVPSRCSKKRMGSSILFTVPKLMNLNIMAFNVYVVYSCSKNEYDIGGRGCVRIRNKTTGRTWAYSPMFLGVPDDSKYMLWFSHWEIGPWLIEGGDKIEVVAKWRSNWSFKVKEIGIQIVYDEHKEEGAYTTSLQNVVNSGDFSPYKVGPGTYFLCNDCAKLIELHKMWSGDHEEGLTDEEYEEGLTDEDYDEGTYHLCNSGGGLFELHRMWFGEYEEGLTDEE